MSARKSSSHVSLSPQGAECEALNAILLATRCFLSRITVRHQRIWLAPEKLLKRCFENTATADCGAKSCNHRLWCEPCNKRRWCENPTQEHVAHLNNRLCREPRTDALSQRWHTYALTSKLAEYETDFCALCRETQRSKKVMDVFAKMLENMQQS